jgi:hypothetical protein
MFNKGRQMADNKDDRGAQDRARVSGEERYELRYFAEKHGISTEQAQDLIDKHGNSRAELDAAAEELKRR